MAITRKTITPLLSGAFLLSAMTGVLLFFHVGSPLARFVHEWLSWALVAVVVLHLTLNAQGFGVALRSRIAKLVVAGFALVAVGSALAPASGAGRHNEGEARLALGALLDAPLDRVAALRGMAPAELRQKLEASGLRVPATPTTLQAVIASNPEKQGAVLHVALD